LVRPSKVKSPWNNAGYGNKATGKEDDHKVNATYTDVSRLHRGWADTSLQCWQQCGGNEGSNASTMRAKMPARHGQQRQRNASNNDSVSYAA
jgi:hypothetical protein